MMTFGAATNNLPAAALRLMIVFTTHAVGKHNGTKTFTSYQRGDTTFEYHFYLAVTVDASVELVFPGDQELTQDTVQQWQHALLIISTAASVLKTMT